MKYIYGVFVSTAVNGSRWATCSTLADAKRLQDEWRGAGEIRRMPYRAWLADRGLYGWDAPTFRSLSEMVRGRHD